MECEVIGLTVYEDLLVCVSERRAMCVKWRNVRNGDRSRSGGERRRLDDRIRMPVPVELEAGDKDCVSGWERAALYASFIWHA